MICRADRPYMPLAPADSENLLARGYKKGCQVKRLCKKVSGVAAGFWQEGSEDADGRK